ncbi:carbohydrate ABC transporter permease [Falsirhodobacter sp. alg1]|uniref:carbohydrate ABC transporter permease n=1 Tax=Falsirhodobacter sp. alg1 TaxID=1472418 RepID=UPI0005EF4FCC|nr:sugar ABC transporter permease [Falsirhodobacter sp. alg1]
MTTKAAGRASAESTRAYRNMLLPALIAVTAFGIVPLMGMFALSLTDYNLIKGSSGHFGLDNFFRLWQDRRFVNSVYVLAALSLLGVAFQVVLGTAVAVGLQKIVPKWKFARSLFLAPYAVPHIAVALVWLSIFTPTLSPINAFFDLFGITVPTMLTSQNGAIAAIVIADTWATYPFVMLLILAALNGISDDLDEASALDGASRIQSFFYITLPLLFPALLMVTLFRFIDTLKHFPLIFVMTKGGPGRSTQATNFYGYVQTFQNSNVSYGAAIAVFLFVFAAIVSFYVARLNVRLTNG